MKTSWKTDELSNRKNRLLILYAVLILPVMIAFFCYFGKYQEKLIRYFAPYGIYLILLLVGIFLFSNGKWEKKRQETKYTAVYYIAAFIPVLATFFVAFLPTVSHMSGKLLVMTGIYALLNGTLEELFWRFTFQKVFEGNLLFAYLIPTIAFTCWHIALTFANGISYHGGALALVGGAGFMGVIWGFVVYRTKNVRITILAHILANFFAFSQLIYQNF